MSIESQLYYRQVYLKSDEWGRVRMEVLFRDHAKCYVCGFESIHNDIHHVKYPKNIWETKEHHCVPLCRECHEKVHILMQKGFALSDLGDLKKLQDYLKNEKSKTTPQVPTRNSKPRCLSCHRWGVELKHYDFGVESADKNDHSKWVFCEDCLLNIGDRSPRNWSLLRRYFEERRKHWANKILDEHKRLD